MRDLIVGHKDPPRNTGDACYRVVIKTSDIRKDPELVQFVDPPGTCVILIRLCLTVASGINLWMGPQCHANFYILQNGESANIGLLCPDIMPEDVGRQAGNIHEMLETFNGWDPKLLKLLSIPREVLQWKLQNREEFPQWVHPSGKVALLGDACHPTLPYLAQGANMAIEDGAVLGNCLGRVHAKEEIGEALRIYEALRKPRTTWVVNASTANRDVFHMMDGPRQQERDKGMKRAGYPGHPNQWADPDSQNYIFGYDADREVEINWPKMVRSVTNGNINGVNGTSDCH